MAMIKSKKKAAHAGLLGQLKSIEQDLLSAIFEYREQGVEVNTFLGIVKASLLSPEFNAKSFTARCSTAKRFIRTHLFVNQMFTHEMQRTSLRKLRVRQRTTCVLYTHLSLAVFVTRTLS